jgi:hypothetical protein
MPAADTAHAFQIQIQIQMQMQMPNSVGMKGPCDREVQCMVAGIRVTRAGQSLLFTGSKSAYACV